ncbi:MAG TPA: hypothetical protein VGQ56_22285 [Gemmatimonadaceae bacterium]|jgi:hypothetical protein|nr:hypothetical protein [Gemmatimonadaceae bacterium]
MSNGNRRTFVVALILAAAFGRDVLAQTTITLLDYHTTVPSGWVARAPSSSSRLAQFVLSGSDSTNNAEVVVFFFGKTQGGNVEANLARWRGQFSTTDGSPVPERVARDSSGTFPITIAEFRGTYRRGIGAGASDSVRAGQALVAAIAETPRGTLFIQLFGAAGRVTSERESFVQFVKGLR